MENIYNEILFQFKDLLNGRCHVVYRNDPKKKAIIFNLPIGYGVGIECDPNLKFNDSFAQIKLNTIDMHVENKNTHVLALLNSNALNKRAFAQVCVDFISPDRRPDILIDPTLWWAEWKEAMGNKSVDYPEYSILGELLLYEYFLLHPNEYQAPIWAGADKHNHDLITIDNEYEVKSTTMRAGTNVHISSEFQLCDNGKTLYLVFFRFIRNGDLCINDIVNRLVQRCNCSEYDIEKKLEACGYIKGSVARANKYYCEECRIYKVEEGNFPILTNNSFVGGKRPTGINHIDYEITLENLSYSTIDASNFNL